MNTRNIILWCGLVLAVAAAIRSAPNPKGDRADGITIGANTRLTAQAASKFVIRELMALPGEAERLDLLQDWLDQMNAADFRRLYDGFGRIEDKLLAEVARGAILDRWIREEPDAVWNAYLRGHVSRDDLVWQWLRSGDRSLLWEKMVTTEGTIEFPVLRSELLSAWDACLPGRLEELQSIVGVGDDEIVGSLIREATKGGQFEKLLELAQQFPGSVTGDLLHRAVSIDHPPLDRFDLAAHVPEEISYEFFGRIFWSWPADLDPGPAVERVFRRGSSQQITRAAVALIGQSGDGAQMTAMVERLLDGEGGQSRGEMLATLDQLAEFHPDGAMTLIVDLDPIARGRTIDEIGLRWRPSDFEGALAFAENLSPGHQQDSFLAQFFRGNDISQDERFVEWRASLPEDRLRRLGLLNEDLAE